MATYAIGDVQGCIDPLRRLLDRLRFDPAQDRLVFAGDLVARGPDSAETLRFVRGLGPAATTVLGNHDLHLLGLSLGIGKPGDGLDAVLRADDAATLLDFVASQSLAHFDAASNTLIVHAGVPPQWTVAQTMALAGELEAILHDPQARAGLLPQMYGNEPMRWNPRLRGAQRWRFLINCFTRMRYCSDDGSLDLRQKGKPGSQPAALQPWFSLPDRASRGTPIVFGHWSTLGQVEWPEWNVWGLDTGCVWGGPLTALRLEDRHIFQVPGLDS